MTITQFRVLFSLAFTLLFALHAQPALADRYQSCAELAARDPDAAYDYALGWETTDTSGGALHCGGLALANLGLFEAAAERFEQAAALARNAQEVERATLFRQAGDAWLTVGNSERGVAAYTAALGYVPNDPALLYGRARAHDLAGAAVEGLSDVNAAFSLAPDRADFLVLRARFERQLGQLDKALTDIETALQTGADTVPVWLERGLILFERGDLEAARRDWQSVIKADQRSDGRISAASAAASRFIEALEAKAEAPTQP